MDRSGYASQSIFYYNNFIYGLNNQLNNPSNASVGTTLELMSLKPNQWATRSIEYLNAKMTSYCDECVPAGKKTDSKGFLERHDLPQNSELTVVGDIHGHDTRLDLSLLSLQRRGFLDKDFKCLPGKYVVFLGDFVDRGKNSLKVLELVITLKLENKDQVFLLRGNHEDLQTSSGKLDSYAANDDKYKKYMSDNNNKVNLKEFYENLPVGLYIGVKNSGTNSVSEYTYFVHGMFYLYTDPSPIFEQNQAHGYLWISGAKQFTPRILDLMKSKDGQLSKSEQKQQQAALKLNNLKSLFNPAFDDIYWLDANDVFYKNETSLRISIDCESMKAYLRLSGGQIAKVKDAVRGHQCGVWVIKDTKGKIVVTTIDPTANTNYQIYMEMKMSEKVQDWKRSYVYIPLLENHTQALSSVVVKDSIPEKSKKGLCIL